MNKTCVILILLLLFPVTVYAFQQKESGGEITGPGDPLISGNYDNTPFNVFADDLKSRYGIGIYFRPEWVIELRVTASGDSINLTSLLYDLLTPHDIHFVYRGSGQYFLTGRVSITDDFTAGPVVDKEADEARSAGDIIGRFSYEKKIERITVGSPENIEIGGALLSGRITSATSGEPVPGATVIVEGTNKGVISDGNGLYAIQLQAGEVYNLTVSCMGMEKESYILELNSTGTMNIEMQEQLIDIREVIVKSGRHDNVRGMQMGFQRIDIKEIKEIPVVMGERDILKVAQLMPGVQNVGEGSSGFNVRGSGSDQNLFLINEVPVLNTGHLFGFFSAFNPDMISDFTLYKNNFPVEYGGRLASIFEISTRKGNKKKFGARGGVSPVTASLLAETPIVNDRSSFVFAGRSTYSDWILRRLNAPELRSSNGSFYDLMSSIHIMPSESSSLQVFGYYSKDRFRLAGTDKYMYDNTGASVVYDHRLNDRWTMNSAAVFSRYTNQHANMENPFTSWQHRFIVDHRGLKTSVTGYQWPDHTITAGAGFISYVLNQGTYEPYGNESILAPLLLGREQGIEMSLFGADEYAISDRLTLYGGIRLNLYKYLGPNDIYSYSPSLPKVPEHITDTTSYGSLETIENRGGPDYRISANYTFSPTASVKASYNRMRQYLFMLSNTIAIAPTDRWKLADPHIEPPMADQVSLGFYKNIPQRALEISLEMYYKKTRNQVEYRDGADLILNPLFETAVVQGEQEGWGGRDPPKKKCRQADGMGELYLLTIICPGQWILPVGTNQRG
ncbi:MAG: TonB-dependent receptor [Bacteroidota bacterium]|nr:TonB-dependent receptor [Bacteroidota bacterium]